MANNDEDLVRAALARLEGIENKSEKARRLGVAESTVRRWLEGEISTPLRAARPALEEFVATHDEEGRPVANRVQEDGPLYPSSSELRMVAARVQRIGGPGEGTERKLDALTKYLDWARSTGGGTPEGFFDLWRRVEAGDL